MTDAIAAVAYEVAARSDPAGAGSGEVSVFDVARFEALHAQKSAEPQAAQGDQASVQASEGSRFDAVLGAMESLNSRIDGLGGSAAEALAKGQDLSPGDMLMLTMRAHEFMFYSELTANVANTSSQGVQQLFRQQG